MSKCCLTTIDNTVSQFCSPRSLRQHKIYNNSDSKNTILEMPKWPDPRVKVRLRSTNHHETKP